MSKGCGSTPWLHSQYTPKQSSPAASSAGFGNAGNPTVRQDEIDIAMADTTGLIADAENNHVETSGGVISAPEPDEMDSWTLPQLRVRLKIVVIEKRAASGQESEDLEVERLALIERVTLAERAEEKRRDAAKRGKILPPQILLILARKILLTL
jgi:hypothetical protein